MKSTNKILVISVMAAIVLAVTVSAAMLAKNFTAAIEEQEVFSVVAQSGEVTQKTLSSEDGECITLYYPSANFSSASKDNITLSGAFTGLNVISAESGNNGNSISVTINGNLFTKTDVGKITVDAGYTGIGCGLYGELYIQGEDFYAENAVDEKAEQHTVIISGDTFTAETKITNKDITFSDAFLNMEYTSYEAGAGEVTVNFSGLPQTESGDYGKIILSPQASGFYMGCEVVVDVVCPSVSADSRLIGFAEEQTIYLSPNFFEFNAQPNVDDFSFEFSGEDDEKNLLQAAFSITEVKNVFGIIALTVDVDENVFDIQLNSYNNAFNIVINKAATGLTRDISVTLIFDTVFCDYEVEEVFAADYTTMIFTFNVDGGFFNTSITEEDISCDRQGAEISASVKDNVLTIIIKVETDLDNRLINFTVDNAIHDDIYNNIFDLEVSHVYGENAAG